MTCRRALAIAVLPLLLSLNACDPGTSPGGAPSGSPTGAPTPSDSPGSSLEIALPADAMLLVQGVVTEDSGAVLDVALVVRAPLTWDAPAGGDRSAAMTEECAGYLDESVYAAQGWTFVQVDVVARHREGTPAWPVGTPAIRLAPFAEHVAVASGAFPADDEEVSGDTPRCDRDKLVTGPGEGSFVIGFGDDIHLENLSVNGTKWAGHNYGFTVPGVVLAVSDCSVTPTDLGVSLGWPPAGGWDEHVSDAGCRYGVIGGEQTDS